MKIKLYLFISLCSYLLTAQQLQDKIPVSTEVLKGKLDNGITYYVRENKKPENRVFLRLVVNAGSVLENDSQQGLAHLIEHMAFNGTKNFEKNELINYLESIGMRFGADVNAYTSFDETVYMLEVPADTPSAMEKGFQILEDWAHNVTFDDSEIDKERGVVIEEWRLGRGSNERMLNKQIPILFKGSRYAERMTIGKKEVLANAPYDTLKQYYKDWYRPNLMAVIAVGDLNKDRIVELIKKHFSNLKEPAKERERTDFPVPDQDSLLFAIATDPEATNTMISMYHKLDMEPQDKVEDYRRGIVYNLFNQMFSERLSERTLEADPPFLYAYSSRGNFVKTKDIYALGAVVKEGELSKGFNALLTEAQKVKKYGFQESELKRAKENSLKSMEQAFNEKDKTPSGGLADELKRNYLTDEPIPGIAYEYELYKKYIPTITLEEINKLADKWIRKNNTVVLVNAPEKEGLKLPSESELRGIFNKVETETVTAYEDKTSDLPLLDKNPGTSSITNSKKIESVGVEELELSNRVRVVLKNTNFKNDEILIYAYSPGGTSLAKPGEYIPAITSSSLISQSGVGKFDVVLLQRMLTGKAVSISPYINDLFEGVSGSSSIKDVETMFQLLYLYFNEPRIDSISFYSYKVRLTNYLKTKGANPETTFSDTLSMVLGNYNYRRMPFNEKQLDSLDIDKSINFYKDRFADASDFTFVVVGNIDSVDIKGLIQKYVGTLPSSQREESWKDLNINPPTGKVTREVYKGIEDKSRVFISYNGDYKWDLQTNYFLYSMVDVLRIKLRELLREDKGGTYGVSVNGSPQKLPEEKYNITISFGCDPARVDELVKATNEEIEKLKQNKVDESYITKVKETQRREFETNLKENSFWLNILQTYYSHGLDLDQLLKYPERVNRLNTDEVQKAFNEYFKNDIITVTLFPEKKKSN